MEIIFEEGGERVVLRGELSEAADLTPISRRVQGRMAIDLAQVTRINSSGVHEWVRFVRALPPTAEVVLERCPVMFVRAVNLIANLLGSLQVRSFFAPLVCPRCHAGRDDLLEVAALGGQRSPALAPCDRCGGGMELDVEPDEYFSFLDPRSS